MELKCAAQKYAWGVHGTASSVAQIASSNDPEFRADENTPYAELWMGTHPNGPSVLKALNCPLGQYLEQHPEKLGSNMRDKFGDQLSFLFKVLSVNEALSIQAHPNKSYAEILHQERPEVYKDPNHKPEMALAVTKFHALCGFRPPEEIISFIEALPELRRAVGEDCASSFVKNPTEKELKNLFGSLMRADKEIVSTSLADLAKRLKSSDETSRLLSSLFLKLYKLYPGDGGCFSIYLLNVIVLEPGEAMFLGPNIIHAYLEGDCIECMACSDNVVRAGLTPKFQDVTTLVEMLEYSMSSADSRKFVGKVIDSNLTLFNPPVPDFAVQMIKVPCGENYTTSSEKSASILLVIEGHATSVTTVPPVDGGASISTLRRGSIIFIEAGQTLSFSVDKEFTGYRALCL